MNPSQIANSPLVIPGERVRIYAHARGKGTQVSMKCYFVYMLASRRNGTLYIGVTNDVIRRAWEHKKHIAEGFTKKYGVHILVWYEMYEEVDVAIAREKQIKGWNRAWKIRLIEKENSGWNDLYEKLTGEFFVE